MAEYVITFASAARRELERIDRSTVSRILAKIEELSMEPRPSGSQKIRGEGRLWRLRVGDYRVIYGVDDSRRCVDIVAVGHRREVYR